MANAKITDLTAYTNPASTDVLPIVDVGADVTKKVSIADLLENAGSGTAAAPGIAFDGDPNTGIYSPGADQIAISTNGTQALYINSDGDILVADGNRMEIDEIRARDGAGLKLLDDGGAGIFVKDGGNVGVGTSSPTGVLHASTSSATVYDKENMLTTVSIFRGSNTDTTASVATGLTLEATGDGAQPAQAAIRCVHTGNGAAALAFGTKQGGYQPVVEAFRIDSLGKIGIGDTGPSETLTVKGESSVDPFSVSGPSSEFLRVNNTGILLLGTSIIRSVGGAPPQNFLSEHSVTTSINAAFVKNTDDSLGAVLSLGKSRGTAVGASTIVQDGDTIGDIRFAGADGNDLQTQAAAIAAEVDGTPGANDMPGRLVFSVTADGASSPTEAMRIKNTRVINFSNTPVYADNAAAKTGGLVNGDVYRTSTGDLKIVYT